MMLWALALVGVGCSSPGQESAAAYVRTLEPLLLENSALSEEVLTQSAAIYNEAAGPKDVSQAWEVRVVPMAEHLASQASFVAPPSDYVQEHAALVQIWGDRAKTYRVLSEATRTANADAWNSARAKVDEVKASENQFFNDLNRRLAPMRLRVDPYP